MVHAILSALFCGLINILALYLSNSYIPWVCVTPASFYIGREIAQAEYRYIESRCRGHRVAMPWWAVFTIDAWTVKGMLDWILPCVVSAICYLYFSGYFVIKG